jgi:predicted acyltransferase
VLLLAYWAACVALAQGGDPYSLEGFFGTHLDRSVLGSAHLYRGEGVPFDPEGLGSTLPAVAQVLLGYAVGRLVVSQRAIDDALLVRLFVGACVLLALAWLWHFAMPVNKKIWTSSYVLATTGAATATLALALRGIEMRGARAAWIGWMEAHGRNALFIFVLSGFLPRVLALFRCGRAGSRRCPGSTARSSSRWAPWRATHGWGRSASRWPTWRCTPRWRWRWTAGGCT